MLKHWIASAVCLALMACGGSSDDPDDVDEGEDGDMCAASGLDFAAGDAAASTSTTRSARRRRLTAESR